MSKRGTTNKPRRRSARLLLREDSPHHRCPCLCDCKSESNTADDDVEELEDIPSDHLSDDKKLAAHELRNESSSSIEQLSAQHTVSESIDNAMRAINDVKQESEESDVVQVSDKSNGRQSHQSSLTKKYSGHRSNVHDNTEETNAELTACQTESTSECPPIKKRTKTRAKNITSPEYEQSAYGGNDISVKKNTQTPRSKSIRRKKTKLCTAASSSKGDILASDNKTCSVRGTEHKSEAGCDDEKPHNGDKSKNFPTAQSVLKPHDKWVERDHPQLTNKAASVTDDEFQDDPFISELQNSSISTAHDLDDVEKTLSMTSTLDRNINAFNDDHASCVRKIPASWMTRPSVDENHGAADDNSLSETIYNGLSLLNSSPSDTNELKREVPSSSSNVMSVMIPNPFTIQHGLQQTFDFAAFRPVSPLSRRECLEKASDACLPSMSRPNTNGRSHTDTHMRNVRSDQMSNRPYGSADSRLKVELTNANSELQTTARRDKIAVSDTRLSLCRESKKSPRPLRRVSRSKSGQQRQTSIVHLQNARAKSNIEKSPRSATGNKMKYPTRMDVPAAGGEASRSSTCTQPANSLLNTPGSQLYRNRRCNRQMTPWLQQALKGTLTQWEDYLRTSSEQMHSFEMENAKQFNYNRIAKSVIEDRDLYVWQLIEDMTAPFGTHFLDDI